ncbi:hypothetical protein CSA56_01455 [candidate division KSB3 bacterium]|uniref:Uncharacterized protein n=1 Tax=candidate division KSB3 bacterium TaxID=2044937 RepID=A0A2G6KKB7_9BACT|nr:MAG: hypothetical protein CSA56_01455 [candidate division KSB3 bacterium]
MTSHGPQVRPRSGLPEGFLDIFHVAQLPSTHPEAFINRSGKAIRRTQQQGFLCFGQYKKGYPTIPLKAFFTILIDDNFSDDRNILILDVYDHHSDRVIGKRLITRKDFPHTGEFSLFEFDFTPPGPDANMEFRIFYMGWAYVLADKIAIVDPARASVQRPSDIPRFHHVHQLPKQQAYCSGHDELCIPSMAREQIAKARGKVIGGNFQNDRFTPTPNGGIEFTLSLDTSRRYYVAFDLEGNIPNQYLGDLNGGKVFPFTIHDIDGNYCLSFQRMYSTYRGGSRFRVLLSDRPDPVEDGAAWLVTSPDISGDYTMRHWGEERHHIEIHVHGRRCQLRIDDFVSKWAQAPYPIGGQRQVHVVLGNREPRYYGAGQAALTQFVRFKVGYFD